VARRESEGEVGSGPTRRGRAGAGDRRTREVLILRMTPMARRIARRFAGDRESVEDLEQVAVVGLIKAIDRFDPRRGSSLPRFARAFVEGELRHHLRDNLGAPKVPQSLRSRASRTMRLGTDLAVGLGRAPSTAELATALDLSRAEVDSALAVCSALAAPRSLQGSDDPAAQSVETLGDEDRGFDLVAERELLARALGSLGRRERLSMFLRVVGGLSYREIADRLGVSERHASRLCERAIERAARIAGRRPAAGQSIGISSTVGRSADSYSSSRSR
jgi:RNA polymerase sigma-B factor